MTNATFGHHLIVDAAACNDRIRDRESIAEFARVLVEAIDMKAYDQPLIEHFGHDEPKASGYTLVQLIETSHIAAHFCDHSGDAYFDIFSCREFDQERALGVIAAYFAPVSHKVQLTIRQAPRSAQLEARASS